ncbi:MAG: hypothetical protein WBA29_18335, partial [Xanthobacteraceae bacterium]
MVASREIATAVLYLKIPVPPALDRPLKIHRKFRSAQTLSRRRVLRPAVVVLAALLAAPMGAQA